MVVGGSQQETLEPGFVLLGTYQQGVPVILKELLLRDGFDPMSPSFTLIQQSTDGQPDLLFFVEITIFHQKKIVNTSERIFKAYDLTVLLSLMRSLNN
ncbi:unnamed protein product [Schistosoma margrebowiei]|uniref:Uncharacterized protein n=1 Tax=Schistosoma margrebowiei TaxID=48269 RepID=A0A183MKJ3_9TREM|nr:unnamed protein product [Schistosoma margrebowiei]